MSKKILILANNDVGLYRFRKELIERMLDQKNEVWISLPDGDLVQPLIEKGCHFIDTPIDRRGINPATDLKLLLLYFKILKKVRPDQVITYTIKPNIYGGIACRMRKIPYASNITGLGTAFQNEGFLRTLVTMMYRCALKKAQPVFFENSENQSLFHQFKICRSADQSRLLHGAGVNLEHFRYADYPEEENQVHFLFVGRVMKEKGVNELFFAMEDLHREGRNCVLDIVGPCEEDFKDQIEQNQKKGWLNYHGYQEDVRPYIMRCHCFVLPSWHEGMANTNLECAAMGRPLITSDIPGCREAVINGKSGLLCKEKDAASLYHTMRQFLDLSPDRHREMGTEGRRHMEREFDKRMVVTETMRALGL